MKTRATILAVVGGADETRPAVLETARRLGAGIAREGWVLLTGGRTGVMSAASAGAHEAGGRVVALLPGTSAAEANPHVEIALATGLGEARNAVIATAADAVVAIGGGHGTLSEMAHAIKLGKPVLVLDSVWESIPGTRPVEDPESAVTKLRQLL